MNNDDEQVVYFGETDARNRRLRFGIKKVDRSRHMYAIGKTGMGKSNLLEVLAVQDIQNGEGLCFLDPHGKSADLLLEYVPEHRIKDVVYFAPFDMEYPISFNVMEDVGPQQRYLVASGMMSAFKKIWVDAWSARMEYILGNIMLALLEYPGSTLVGVNRMLTDKDFRKEVVEHITDPSVKSFWVNEYANYTDKFAAEAAPAIQNKVGQFVANPLIRNIIGQAKSSFDIREIMDNKKILIINLSKGRVGEANANLLGSMLITKIYLAAMSRADLKEKELSAAPNFNLYVDEFQSFANESFADILSEARKYKLSLCIAHQYIEQMTEEVRAAVFGNVGTMCVFRVGAYDAEVLEKEFAPHFTAEDIVSLQKHQMYLKLMIDGVTSPPFSASGMPPIPRPEISYMKEIIDTSRAQYAKPRQQIEDELLAWINTQFGKGAGSGTPSAFGKSSPQNPANPASPANAARFGNSSGASGSANSASSAGASKPSHGAAGRDQGSSQGPRGDGGPRAHSPQAGSRGAQNSGQAPQNRSQDAGQSQYKPSQQANGQRPASQGESRNPAPERRAERAERPEQSGQGRERPAGETESKPRPESGQRRDGAAANAKLNDMNARENKFRNAISLGYLKAEQEPKNDQKAPKAENLNALRDALLSVMGSSALNIEENAGDAEKKESGAASTAGIDGSMSGDTREQVAEVGFENEGKRFGEGAQERERRSNNSRHNHTGGNQHDSDAAEKKVNRLREEREESAETGSREVSEEELKKLLG